LSKLEIYKPAFLYTEPRLEQLKISYSLMQREKINKTFLIHVNCPKLRNGISSPYRFNKRPLHWPHN